MRRALLLLTVLSLFYTLSAQQEYKNNIKLADNIKKDTLYYWGLSDKMDDYEDAQDNAFNNLFKNIQNNYKSNARLFPGDQQDQLQNIFKTFNEMVIQQSTSIILIEGDENQVFVYLSRKDFRQELDRRCKEIEYYVKLGNDAYEKDNQGDALRYYYISLMLTYSHPNSKNLEMEIDGKKVILEKWLSARIDGDDGIINTLNFNVKEWNEEGNAYKVRVRVTTKDGCAVTNVILKYNNGNTVATTRVENGNSLLTVEVHDGEPMTADMLEIEVDMNYNEIERECPVAYQMMKSLKKKVKFNGTAHELKKPEGKKPTKKGGDEENPEIKVPKTKKDDPKDYEVKDIKPYVAVMEEVEKAIRSHNYQSVRGYFTDEGWVMFEKLSKYGKGTIIRQPDYKFIKFKNEVICRYVPMQFQFNRVSFARDIVFRFDESTQQINSLAFRLSDVSERDLIKATKSSMNSTLVIMTFLEDYQTSYGLRRIEYLEQVLSDNALIIVGHVVDKAEVADQRTLNLDAKQVSFIRRTKAEYIANLRDKFARLDYINIHFANLEVERSSSDEETYGIQVKQYYYASNYSDEGYLFLMVDLTGDTPIIHVRAWQDVKTDIRDLVTLRDVF